MNVPWRLVSGLTLALGLVVAGVGAVRAQTAGTASPLCAQTAYDGRYCSLTAHGWQIFMNAGLAARHAPFAARVMDLLTRRLEEAAHVLPPVRLRELRRVPIWIEDKETGATSFYHLAGSSWPRANGYPEAKMGSFEIPDPSFFLRIQTTQPSIVIHELAHAYHDQVLSYENPSLLAAFRQALDKNLYGAVRRNDGTTGRAYTLTNHHEYFAELTEAYYATNDFFPFLRHELQAHDPVGFEALRVAWETQPEMVEEPIVLTAGSEVGANAKAGCAAEGRLKSQGSAEAARMVFRNSTTQPVRMFWLDFQGNRRAYELVAGGGLYIQRTFVSHAWLLADTNGRCMAIVMPKKDGSYVALAP